jgi:hypothetical protein
VRKEAILAASGSTLSPDVEAAIRAKFRILLGQI